MRSCLVTAKVQHPDVNSAPGAGEAFKRLTAAYTQALLDSRRRTEEGERQAASGPSGANRSWHGTATAAGATQRSQAGSSVDPRLFNVRQWEAHHYGMHGAGPTDQHSWQSTYARKLHRQHQGQRRAAGAAASAARAASESRPSSFGQLLCSIALAGFVWTLVYQTNAARFREAREAGAARPAAWTRKAGK